MTKLRAIGAVSFAWITIGTLAWEQHKSIIGYLNIVMCSFAKDLGYLTFSSGLSSYLPLPIMSGACWKMYMVV